MLPCLEDEKEQAHLDADPGRNGDDANNLAGQQIAAAAGVEGAKVDAAAIVSCLRVRVLDEVRLRSARGPGASGSMPRLP